MKKPEAKAGPLPTPIIAWCGVRAGSNYLDTNCIDEDRDVVSQWLAEIGEGGSPIKVRIACLRKPAPTDAEIEEERMELFRVLARWCGSGHDGQPPTSRIPKHVKRQVDTLIARLRGGAR